MKSIIVSGIATFSLVVGTATLTVATTKTTKDVHNLASAELRVVNVLHHYQGTAVWRKQLEAAVAAQTAELAKVDADVSGSKPPTTSATSIAKSGTLTIDEIGVPSSSPGCGNARAASGIQVQVENGAGSVIALATFANNGVGHMKNTSSGGVESIECTYTYSVSLPVIPIYIFTGTDGAPNSAPSSMTTITVSLAQLRAAKTAPEIYISNCFGC